MTISIVPRPAGVPHGDPIVNQAGMRDSLGKFGPANQTDVLWEDLVDPRTVEFTANDNTVYNFIWLTPKKGRWSWRSSRRPWRRKRFLVPLGRGYRYYRRGSGQRRQVSPSSARYKGDVPEGYLVVGRAPMATGCFSGPSWSTAPPSPASVGQEAPEDLSAFRGCQSAGDEVRQCFGRPLEFCRPRRLRILGTVEQGNPGRAGGRKRSDDPGPDRLHRHRQG